MNKYVKLAVVVAIVVGVFVFSLLISGKQSVKFIDFEDYSEISKGDGFVYYGSKESLQSLSNISYLADIEINILDSEKYPSEKLKEDTFYQYEKGNEVYKYRGDIEEYDFKKDLMDHGFLKTYKKVSIDEYKKIIKKDGYHFMFIGSEQCGYCLQFKDVIDETLKEYDYNVYYIDTSSMSEDEYKELVDTDKYLSENEWGTPLNLLYKDGKRIAELNGYVPSDELIKFLEKNKVI